MSEPAQPVSSTESTENYLETYSAIGEWIRFADAKAAVVLTVVGALASVLIPTFGSYTHDGWQRWLVISLFWLWAILMVGAAACAVWCVLPIRKQGRHPALDHCKHFHPAAISFAYREDEVDKFVDDCQRSGPDGFERQVLAGLLIDSHVSAAKYRRVTTAIKLLVLGAPFGFAYLLAMQVL